MTTNTNQSKQEMVEKAVKQAARLFHEGNLPSCHLLVSEILKIDSNNDEALQIAGLLKLRTGEAEAAVKILEDARTINPGNPDHHNNLSLAYSRMGRFEEACTCLRTAISMASGRVVFWVNYAVQLRNMAANKTIQSTERMEFLDEAEVALHKAISLEPESPSAYANLASLYAERQELTKSIILFKKALELDPTLSGAHVDLSYVYFLTGDFKNGWEHYEHRMKHYPQAVRWEKVFPFNKRWDGKTPLSDKTVIVFCEQGCGDAIHFARYLPLLQTKKLFICCHDPLKEILAEFGEVYGMGQKTPEHDVSIPIMSLPFLLGDPPTTQSYIKTQIPAKGMDQYKNTFNVGICWAGNPQHPGDRFRSIPLQEFIPLGMPGVTLFSLQKDYRPRKYHDTSEVVDLCKDGPKVVDLSSFLVTFMDTAKFISAMDLVISVDTAVLHLAGAMGKKTWALLPYSPDWRWGIKGNTTPLYPSIELFRQPEKNDWKSVLEMVSTRLKNEIPPVGLTTGG